MPNQSKLVIALVAALIFIVGCVGSAVNSDSHETSPVPPPAAEKQVAAEKGVEERMERQQPYIMDQVIVKFSDTITAEAVQHLVDEHGLRLKKALGMHGLYLLAIPDGRSVDEVIETLEADERVTYAEPNYILKTNQ
jgi:hypothetical protein